MDQDAVKTQSQPLLDCRLLNPVQKRAIYFSSIRSYRWKRHKVNNVFKANLKQFIIKQNYQIKYHYHYAKLIKKSEQVQTSWLNKVFPDKMNELQHLSYPKDSFDWDLEYNAKKSKFDKMMLCGFPYQFSKKSLSGTERLKIAFLPWFYNENYSRDEANVYNFNWRWIVQTSNALGVLGGALQGYGHGKAFLKSFDEKGKNRFVFESMGEAKRERSESFFRGFSRYFFKWWWRIALLSGIYLTVTESMTIYKLESKSSHHLVGGFIAGSLYKWTQGPIKMVTVGTMGMVFAGLASIILKDKNFRAEKYYSGIHPKVSSPYYYKNLTEKQLQNVDKNAQRVIALCNIPEHDVDQNVIKECEKYIGTMDQSLLY